MTKRKPTTKAHPGVVKFDEYVDESKSYPRTIKRGDSITADVPWTKAKRTTVTFSYYVVPDSGKPYVEVIDRDGKHRCIRPEAIDAKKRKGRGIR